MSNPIPEPDYEDEKELWAFFGLAYYKTQVLEQGVVNLAVAMQARGVEGVTVGDVDSLYDAFDRKTFGRIIKAARTLFEFPEEVEKDLEKALEYRNYLAHRFFLSHDADLLTPEGRRKIIGELIDILKFLNPLDEIIDEIWTRAWEPLGMTKEWIAEQFKAIDEHRKRANT